ncbi:sunset domain-containing protein [Kutzneria buriramensis]
MWVFGQVWLLCLLSFVIGGVLDAVLFSRPLRKQVRQLEIQLAKAKRAEAAPPPAMPVPAESDVERTSIVDEHPSPASGWDPDRLPSWERGPESPRTLVAPQPEHDLGYDRPDRPEPQFTPYEPEATRYEPPAAEPPQFPEPATVEPQADRPQLAADRTRFEPLDAEPHVEADYHVEAGYHAEHGADQDNEPAPAAEPEPEPVAAQEQPPADEQPTQIQAPVPAAPPIPNPSPAEMTAAINRLVGEANAAETTSILPPALDPEDMELADHGPVTPARGQLAHVPTADLEDEHLVDDVVDDDLTESEREAAAETTGPVAVSVIAAAQKAVQERRLAGELAEEEPAPEPEPEAASRHSLFEQPAEPADGVYDLPENEPAPEPEPEPEVQLEALAEPIRLDPNQFGKPIPPGALTPPGSVTPPEPAESATPLPTRPPRPEPAPMEAVARPRSLFEPVLDPDGDDPYDDLDGFAPIQEPTTRSFTSTDSVPFTPILAPELLAAEQPKPPPASTSAGLPKRTVSSSWPRGGNGLSAGPEPFDPAPFRPRQAFSTIPRNTDAAPIRRPSSGGPRTPFGPGSALPKPDGSAPSDDFQVKAVIGSRTYHTASSGGFAGAKAEVWFRSAEEAERAGFNPAD